MVGQHGNSNNASTRGFDFITANDFVYWPISAFNQDVGKQSSDDLARRGLVENNHGVHAFQSSQDFGSFTFLDRRSVCTFELFDCGVAVQADDQRIPEFTRSLQYMDVAGMQDVEATVREHHATSVAFLAAKPQNRFVQSENRWTIQRISVQGHRQKRMALPEALVYHARIQRRPRARQGR
jgi:hypothetical protein